MNQSFAPWRSAVIGGLALLLSVGPAFAQSESEPDTRAELILQQRREKAAEAKPEEPTGVEKKLLILKDRQILQRFGQDLEGFFPKFGGLATGQGLAGGVQYRKKGMVAGEVDFAASGVVSRALSQRYIMEVAAPRLAGDRLELSFLGDHRNLSQVDFYGLGPDSDLEDRTSFRLEDTTFLGTAAVKPFGRYVRTGAKGAYILINTGEGQRPGFPSTGQIFSADRIPGLADQTNFVRFGPFVELDFRDNPSGPRAGSYLSAEYQFFNDQELGRHDFRQLDAEAQQYIPFFNKRRVIMLRARTVMTFTEGSQTVPFYLKPWIGGPRELRGFRNYRFFDDNILILNAEYRWEAFSGLDMALFFDAGQAVPERDAFQLKELETNVGLGFRFNIRNSTFLRLDTAFSHEGMQIWFRFGSPF